MTAMQTDPSNIDEDHHPPRPGVVERLTQILDTFSDGPEHLLLEDITNLTGLPRSTTFRILAQLVDLQWVDHDAHGYRLGTRVHGIVGRGEDHSGVRAAAANALNDLHVGTGTVAHLAVLEGDTVLYLDKVGGALSATVPSCVGARFPAETTVSGLALLAALSPERVDVLMSVNRGGRALRDLTGLHAKLNQVRQRHGLAFAHAGNHANWLSAVAAPVLGPDDAVGAISIASRSAVPLDSIAPMVAFAARRTSQGMFPGLSPRRPSVRRRSAARWSDPTSKSYQP